MLVVVYPPIHKDAVCVPAPDAPCLPVVNAPPVVQPDPLYSSVAVVVGPGNPPKINPAV